MKARRAPRFPREALTLAKAISYLLVITPEIVRYNGQATNIRHSSKPVFIVSTAALMSETLTDPVCTPANARFAGSRSRETLPPCVGCGQYVGFDSAATTACEISQVWMLRPPCVQNWRQATR